MRSRIIFALCAVIAAGVLTATPTHAAADVCTSKTEAFATHDGETRRHLRQRIGDVPELWHHDRVRDYPGCIAATNTLRVRYAVGSNRVVAAWWLTCERHHAAECTKERLT